MPRETYHEASFIDWLVKSDGHKVFLVADQNWYASRTYLHQPVRFFLRDKMQIHILTEKYTYLCGYYAEKSHFVTDDNHSDMQKNKQVYR